jgi:CCR4-NOT transcription complex subunit 1
MKDSTRLLYKSTLRALLVLVHDFPEFLCAYHMDFCEHIPIACTQLRNIILYATPRDISLPDLRNIKVDKLPEINQQPLVLSNYVDILEKANLKEEIDNYLKTRDSIEFIMELHTRLTLPSTTSDTDSSNNTPRYNIPLINALIMYIGVQVVTHNHSNSQEDLSSFVYNRALDIYQQLLIVMDTEGKYTQ